MTDHPSHPPSRAARTEPPLSVLVVDDDDTSRLLLRKLVQRLGFQAKAVANGQAALDELTQHSADIILLDLLMPGMDGFQTARHIRAMPNHGRTPIVVISALESMENIVAAIEAGADDYLIKPFRVQILSAKLSRLAEGIQARKAQLEEALRATAISETVMDSLIIIDTRGVIEWVNPATEIIFGYPPAELLGLNVSMLMPEPMHSAHDGYLARYQQSGHERAIGKRRRLRGLHANGHTFPIELSIQTLQINGKSAFLGMVRDMSEFEKLSHMKRDFISVINHELRTPLTSIVGSLSLLAAGAVGELPPKAHKLVEMAERNTSRLGRLINDILDLDKLDSKSLKLRLQTCDAKKLLEEAVAFHSQAALLRNVELRLEWRMPDGEALPLHTDPDRFQQIMSNLLSNAIKHSPAGSPVTVSAQKEHGCLRVGVRDWGAGIPDEFRSRIFQRFSQAERAETRSTEGSGLGLFITKSLIEAMHGRIDFDSEPMRGSKFFFHLPLANGDTDPGDPPDGQA